MCTMNDDVLPESTPPDTVFEYVDISNVTEGHISEDVNTYAFGAAPSRARRVVRDGDVVVSTVRTYLRAIAQVPKHMSDRIFSTGFAVLRPGERIDPRYLAYVLGSRQVIDEIVATNPDKVVRARENPQLVGWFVGQVMKASGGKANPQAVNELLRKKLGL